MKLTRRARTDLHHRRGLVQLLIVVPATMIVYLGLVANLDVALKLASGRPLDLSSGQANVFQYGREAIVIGVLFAVIFSRKLLACPPLDSARKSILLLWTLFFAWQELRVVLDPSISDVSGVLGIRLYYIVLIPLLAQTLPPHVVRSSLGLLSSTTIPVFLFEIVLAAVQIAVSPPVLGTTVFGSRPWGTFSSSNNLGLFAVSMALLAMFRHDRAKWVLTCLAAMLCLVSGSRNAIICILLVGLGALLARLKQAVLVAPLVVVMLFGAYLLASSKEVSGRNINGELRFDQWSQNLAYMQNPGQWTFGLGLGTGSNAATNLNGLSTASAQIIDSTLLATLISTGLSGLVILVIVSIYLVSQMSVDVRWLAVPAVTLSALTFVLPELSPLNLIAALCVSVSSTPRYAPGSTERIIALNVQKFEGTKVR